MAHVSGGEQTYDPRDACAAIGSQDRFAVSSASQRFAGKAGPNIRKTPCRHFRAWLLLAPSHGVSEGIDAKKQH